MHVQCVSVSVVFLCVYDLCYMCVHICDTCVNMSVSVCLCVCLYVLVFMCVCVCVGAHTLR